MPEVRAKKEKAFFDKRAPVFLPQITIQSWYMNGLLRDDLSTDNGIILSTAERWVLMVDPQVRLTFEAIKANTQRLLDSPRERTACDKLTAHLCPAQYLGI